MSGEVEELRLRDQERQLADLALTRLGVFVVVAVLQRAQQSLDLGAADIQHLLEVNLNTVFKIKSTF
jgi:hypothetical protein